MRFKSNEPLIIKRGIRVRPGQDPLTAYKKLIRRLKNEGFFDELRTREFFTKPCIKRKNAKSRAIARERKRQYQQQSKWGPIPSSISPKRNNKGKSGKRTRFMEELEKNAKIRRRNAKKGRRKAR